MAGAAGRQAIVTGAAQGIGLAVARRLLREGASVLAVDVNAEGLRAIAAEGATTLTADVSKAADRERVIAAAEDADYLVNAAGIIRLKPIFESTLDDLHDIYSVNVDSTWEFCRRIGPRLRPGGAIVNLSSSSAKLATTTDAAIYASSKAAILSITRSFAYALAPRPVRVNAICPGIIDTPMQDDVLARISALKGVSVEQLSATRTKMVPLDRTASADECAGAIWFLLSDESAYMTGQAMNFTGGLVMH
jgi:NAD(P)-dependent dehydrogenase (short-subunit alcohol dehydrogenase family)